MQNPWSAVKKDSMKRWWRRYWLIVALTAAALAVVAVLVVVDRLTREAPNYSLIEEGFYLGGRVPAPPPGTRAVLNLCETEDAFQVEVQRWEPIHDAEPAPSLNWLQRQVEFIDRQRQAGLPLFVHCLNGASVDLKSKHANVSIFVVSGIFG